MVHKHRASVVTNFLLCKPFLERFFLFSTAFPLKQLLLALDKNYHCFIILPYLAGGKVNDVIIQRLKDRIQTLKNRHRLAVDIDDGVQIYRLQGQIQALEWTLREIEVVQQTEDTIHWIRSGELQQK